MISATSAAAWGKTFQAVFKERPERKSFNSITSRPFTRPTTGKIAIKVIKYFGDEAHKVFDV